MSGLVEGFVTGFLQDKANDYAGEKFQPTKDPYFMKIRDSKKPDKEIEVKRTLPQELNFAKQDHKHWKSLQNSAWSHDRSVCGCCCWSDFVGWAPIVSILPVIGPALMYKVHRNLIMKADKWFQLPEELKLKLYGNIGFDLAISLVPILGILFSWMNACSTRNLAMVYNFVVERQNHEHARQNQQQQEQQQQQQQQQQLNMQQRQMHSDHRTNSQIPSESQNKYRRQPPPIPPQRAHR